MVEIVKSPFNPLKVETVENQSFKDHNISQSKNFPKSVIQDTIFS